MQPFNKVDIVINNYLIIKFKMNFNYKAKNYLIVVGLIKGLLPNIDKI
jgi:hypothetical protein